jgi:sodium transport system permease protein
MKIILTVLKKEIKDTLRDRRTLFTAIVLPAIVFPLMFMGMTKIETQRMEDEANKKLTIGVVSTNETIGSVLSADSTFIIETKYDADGLQDAIQQNKIDGGLLFTADTASTDGQQGSLTLFYKSTSPAAYARLMQQVAVIEKMMVQQKLTLMEVDVSVLTPLTISAVDVVTPNEELVAMIGSIFPIIFIIFCFIGCMYPAIDLITGEKEKGTIETLLTVPSSRFEILIGKMIAISLVGLMSAILTIIGVFISVNYFSNSSEEMTTGFSEIISPKSILLLLGMLIPLSIFFSGLLSAVVIRTRSFKESQSVVTPITFIIAVPAVLAVSPGVQLNWGNVWIPVYNMAIAIEEIMAGTISMAHYSVIVLTLFAAAFVAAYFSVKQFSNENMIVN